jgi:hypothetical protein
MANICTNLLYLSTSDNELGKNIVDSIRDSFDCSDGQIHDSKNEYECEMEFESKWTFPDKYMEELTENLSKESNLYIRVLSYEFGCEYVGFNIYAGGEWCDKFADK